MATDTASTAFDTARLLNKFRLDGVSFADVTAMIGGRPDAETMTAMIASWRAEETREEFAAWVNA